MNNNQNNEQPLNVITGMNANSNNDVNNINQMINQRQNRFINSDVDPSASSLNNLNITTDNNQPKVDYTKDPQVMENLSKKNTINIGSEAKVFIIIIIVLLVFIFALPTVFDYIRQIQNQ
jgi:hypothetical protein